MTVRPEIVVTATGAVSPLGVGAAALDEALWQPRSGVGPISLCDSSLLQAHLAGEVRGFDAKEFVGKQHRKSLKIMSRSMQMGVVAAQEAWAAAGLGEGKVDPDRVGVVFGADNMCTSPEEAAISYVGNSTVGHIDLATWQVRTQATSFPLGMLRTLPNLVACHVSIVLDARGPNDTHHHNEASSLMAIAEGMRLIERRAADVVIAGGASSLTDPYDWARSQVLFELSPAREVGSAPRPFDARRDGQVRGEGAGVLVLESRAHAESRGAKILARLPGYGSAAHGNGAAHSQQRAWNVGHEPTPPSPRPLVQAIQAALRDADMTAADIGFVSAQGLGTIGSDRLEAAAIAEVLPQTPVTATKSYFGNLGAGAGGLEAVAAVLALQRHEVPAILNHAETDAACKIRVVHGKPLRLTQASALLLNFTAIGQAATLVITAKP